MFIDTESPLTLAVQTTDFTLGGTSVPIKREISLVDYPLVNVESLSNLNYIDPCDSATGITSANNANSFPNVRYDGTTVSIQETTFAATPGECTDRIEISCLIDTVPAGSAFVLNAGCDFTNSLGETVLAWDPVTYTLSLTLRPTDAVEFVEGRTEGVFTGTVGNLSVTRRWQFRA